MAYNTYITAIAYNADIAYITDITSIT
jgi:hypothetical protein